jgi:hypothetical protein
MKYGDGIYGQLNYGAGEIELVPEIKPVELMKYLPLYYSNSRVMDSMQHSVSKELNELNTSIADIFNQLFVDTATWGLSLWENELEILSEKDKATDYRRSIIKSKLHGKNITTTNALEDIAAIFSGGQTDITEFPSEYRFVVEFIGTRGIPPNMTSLTKAIESIKPAHLAFSYEYTYCVWSEASTYTWDAAAVYNWDGFHTAKPKTSWNSSWLKKWEDFYYSNIRQSWNYSKRMVWEEFCLAKSNL